MSTPTDKDPAEPPEKRGEAKWKAAKEAIAARNAQVRRAGKVQREAEERRAADARRGRELRERAALGDEQRRS